MSTKKGPNKCSALHAFRFEGARPRFESDLVLETVNRRGNTTAAGHERLTARLIHRNDGSVAHEAAEFGHVAQYKLPDGMHP